MCVVYDCLYPWTVGGAERWYRNLAERLAQAGHDVTYLTRRQWSKSELPEVPGVSVIVVSREEPLYGPDGNRRIGEALRFGWGVLRHLAKHRKQYDVVHTASFPYFSLLAAAAIRPLGRYRLIVDWHEVWTKEYWQGYIGPLPGAIGHLVQRACVLVRQEAFCFSRLHQARLVSEGLRALPVLLEGEYAGPTSSPAPRLAGKTIVFAARQIREKNAPAVVQTVAELKRRGIEVRAIIFGDGPERSRTNLEVERLGLEETVEVPGFVPAGELQDAMAQALCLLHPSEREGYGLVVIEAASMGTPVILARGADNAATELVEPGVNGFIARSASANDLADAIELVIDDGEDLRRSTWDWFSANVERLSMDRSIEAVMSAYSSEPRARS